MWNQSTGHDMLKKWGKHQASNSPNVMLCPGFEAIVTSVPSLSTKRVTSFCFLLPFAVVTPILGLELRRKCPSENKTIRLVLILQSRKGSGGVRVHVLDPEIPTQEFKP